MAKALNTTERRVKAANKTKMGAGLPSKPRSRRTGKPKVTAVEHSQSSPVVRGMFWGCTTYGTYIHTTEAMDNPKTAI